MEMQGAIVNRLSESTLAGAVVSRNSPLHKRSTRFLEGGVGTCSCPLVSSSALGNISGGFQAISSGQSSGPNVTCKIELSNSKQHQSKRYGQQNSLRGQVSGAARIFSLSLSGISFGTAFLGTANAAGGAVAKKKSASLTLAAFAVTKVAYEKVATSFSTCIIHYKIGLDTDVARLHAFLQKNGSRRPVKKGASTYKEFLGSFFAADNFASSIISHPNAGSGSQARAVIDGLPADVVSLALPLDVIKIEEAGLIDHDWQQRVPNNGVPAETTVCLVTRPGNPKQIIDWADLSRSDVSVLTANPKTAGVARWNFLALWGSTIITGGDDEDAQQFVEDVFRNVPVEPRDAREVSDVFFKQEIGDAMITYENEIFLTNEKIIEDKGEALPFTVPEVNVRVETALAVVDKNARKNGVHEIATAFVEFCFTEPAQREYAKSGFRPYLDSVAAGFAFAPILKQWRVEEEIGDWLHVQKKFFADKAIVDIIEENIRETRVSI